VWTGRVVGIARLVYQLNVVSSVDSGGDLDDEGIVDVWLKRKLIWMLGWMVISSMMHEDETERGNVCNAKCSTIVASEVVALEVVSSDLSSYV
jgi:hypothetical protein